MKKFLLFFASALLLVSCSNDDFTPSGVEGQEQEVTISFEIPGELQSRAQLSGTSAQGGVSNLNGAEITFNVALYYQGDQAEANDAPAWVGTEKGAKSVTFKPTLVIGKKYRIVAVAAYNGTAWSIAKGAENVNVLAEINNEAKDAYYCDKTVTAEAFMKATLYRPYGKVRLVTTDWEEALKQFNTDGIKNITVSYANDVEAQFNPLTGEFESKNAYTATANSINEYVENDGEKTLVVDYLPTVSEGASLYNFTVAVEFNNGEIFSREFNMDVPVKRNYVTTLIGDFFTSTAQLDVEVDDAFENTVIDANLYYAFQDGGYFTLNEDVTLGKAITLAEGKTLNLDLGGKTLTLSSETASAVVEIINNGTLNISNGKIVAATADELNRRCVYNYGTMTINNVEFVQSCATKGAAINNEGKMTIKDATVNSVFYSIWNSGENAEMVIESGSYTTTNDVEVKNTWAYCVNNINGAKLIVNGGEFEGNHGVIASSGNNSIATLNAGTFYCNAGYTGNSDWTLYASSNATILYNAATCTIKNDNTAGTQMTESEGVVAAMAEATSGNLADVLAAVANQESAVITLKGETTWETGGSHGSTPWVAEGAALKNLIVEGNGTATLVATGAGVGPIRAANGGKITFRNLKIVDQSVSYNESAWELCYLEFAGNLKFENCEFVNAIMVCGQTPNNSSKLKAEFVNCTFNSNKDSEYDVWVSGDSASFSKCKFLGYRGLKMHEAYGSNIAEVIVDGNSFGPLSKKPGIAIGNVDASTVVKVINNTFTDCQPGDQGKYIYESDTDVATFLFTCENNKVVNSASTNDAFHAAIANGAENIVLSEGTYTLQSGLADGAVIEGAGEETVIDMAGKIVAGYTNVTFKNLTIKNSNVNYKGLQHSENLKFVDCSFEGQVFSYSSNAVYEGCTFTQTSADAYNIWTYGSNVITFNNCVFNSAGKAVLVYKETGSTVYKANFNNCKFYATSAVEGKAAIEIDSSLNPYEVYINGCTATGYANGSVSGNSLWNNKKGNSSNLKVVVDGVEQAL